MKTRFGFLLLAYCKVILADDAVLVKDAADRSGAAHPDAIAENVDANTGADMKKSTQQNGDYDGDELDLSAINPDNLSAPIQFGTRKKKSVDRSKLPKLKLSQSDINSRTDSELYQLFYDNAKERDQWIEDHYRSIINKMTKPDISEAELKVLFDKRTMLEKKRENMEDLRKKKAEKVGLFLLSLVTLSLNDPVLTSNFIFSLVCSTDEKESLAN